MKVSVIIPVKNRAHLIGETLTSIFGQTLQPFEVIVVNDGSSDDIVEALNPFSDKVTLLNNSGSGPGAARNTGLKIAQGDVIQFFDSDDIMSVNKLEVQTEVLRRNLKNGIVYGPYVPARTENGKWVQTDVVMQYYPLPDKKPLNELVAEGWCAITQACLFSKEILDKAGPWREDILTHEDKEYWYRLGKFAPFPVHENKTCTIYRQHQQQITDRQTADIERTKHGIVSLNAILEMALNDEVSLKSTTLLKGMLVNYKKYCSNNGLEYALYPVDYINWIIYKINSKLGRIKTGTQWHPIYGPSASPDLFNKYLKLIIAEA